MKRFEKLARDVLTVKIAYGDELQCSCPFCGGNSSLDFNVASGLWNCFRCSESGNAKSLGRRMHVTVKEAQEEPRTVLDRLKKISKGTVGMPLLDDSEVESRFNDIGDDYWHNGRLFGGDTIATWGLGYDLFSGHYTLALRDEHGRLRGSIQHNPESEDQKYKYPYQFSRRNFVYGIHEVKQLDEMGEYNDDYGLNYIALVEGPTDAIRLNSYGIPAVAQLGSSLSEFQATLIIREINPASIVLFHDYDLAGMKAQLKAKEMLHGRVITKTPQWESSMYCPTNKVCGCGHHFDPMMCSQPMDCDCSRIHNADPNSINRHHAWKLFNNAQV